VFEIPAKSAMALKELVRFMGKRGNSRGRRKKKAKEEKLPEKKSKGRGSGCHNLKIAACNQKATGMPASQKPPYFEREDKGGKAP